MFHRNKAELTETEKTEKFLNIIGRKVSISVTTWRLKARRFPGVLQAFDQASDEILRDWDSAKHRVRAAPDPQDLDHEDAMDALMAVLERIQLELGGLVGGQL